MGRVCIWVALLRFRRCWRTNKWPGIITPRTGDGEWKWVYNFHNCFNTLFSLLFSTQLRDQVQPHQVHWDHRARPGCGVGEWGRWRTLWLPFGRFPFVQLQHNCRCAQVSPIVVGQLGWAATEISLSLSPSLFQMHATEQEQWLSENLFGLVSRIREIQDRHEVLGKETSGKLCGNWIDSESGSLMSHGGSAATCHNKWFARWQVEGGRQLF